MKVLPRQQALFRTCSAFTLIELLVVVAIIALLIALLTPSLKRARAQTHELVCRANLHQLHIALESYAHHHKGWYPLEPYECNPHRTLLDVLHAERHGIIDAFYCPRANLVEEYAQNTSDYPPKGLGTSIIDTSENRRLGNITYFYWSMKDRSPWRASATYPPPQYDEETERLDSFRPRHLRNSGLPVPFKPSTKGDGAEPHPNTPCALQARLPTQFWVFSDFFRKQAPFPHTRSHKQGLNVLYLDGHAAWMYGRPRENFR